MRAGCLTLHTIPWASSHTHTLSLHHSSYRTRVLSSCLLPSDFATKLLYAFLSSRMPYWLIVIISVIIRPLKMTKHLCVWSTPLSSGVLCVRFKCSHKRCFLEAHSRPSPFTVKAQVLDPYKAASKCTLRLCMRNYDLYLTLHFCSGIFLFMHPKWWAIRLMTSAPVNEAKDAVRLLCDIWEAHLGRNVASWLDHKNCTWDYYKAGSWSFGMTQLIAWHHAERSKRPAHTEWHSYNWMSCRTLYSVEK